MDFGKLAKTAANAIVKHSPAILTGLGIVGFGTTVAMTAKAAPKAKVIHDRWKVERYDIEQCEDDDAIKRKRIFKTVTDEGVELLPVYGPVGLMAITSIGCFIGANKIQVDRQAAIMAAYSLSEKTLTTYQNKVIEKLGQETHQDILDEATKELVSSNPPNGYSMETEIIPAGTVRCYDNVTGRYFYSTREKIMEAESAINKRLLNETRIPLQEFYYEMGLEDRFAMGDSLGWDISSMYSPQLLDIWFTPMLDDEKNPCLVLNYHAIVFDRVV